jgi:hypothetical protein
MPIHYWTRVNAGTFHDFIRGWQFDLRRPLNKHILPRGYYTVAEWRHAPHTETKAEVGRSFPVSESDARASYARRADRIAVRDETGRVVAVIEVVSPGNKDTRHAIASFVRKVVDFLHNGINLVVIDLFPPTPRDPDGVHRAIWNELTDEPFAERPANKPLTVAGYDAGDPLVAYVDNVAVGDALPDVALFLAPGWYINIPLEVTYNRSWEETPQPIRALVAPPV